LVSFYLCFKKKAAALNEPPFLLMEKIY
jgi:hypothetical protein